MKYLLDTNVISEPTRPRPEPRVIQWLLGEDPADLFISSIVLAEIWQGIGQAQRGSARQAELEAWADELPANFRVLNFDERAARAWGVLASGAGHDLPLLDALLAAVAKSRGLILATRNENDFRRAGIKLFNPWRA